MARRHWLDPLARRLLIASGQLPPDSPVRPDRPSRGRSGAAERGPSGGAGDPLAASADPAERHDALERDLLALKLAQNPGLRLRDAEEVRHAAALGWRLDVNQATAADWTRLPGCTAERADLLARLRAAGVQLSGPEDLQAVLGLDGATLASWLPLLSFRWYGDAVATGPAAVAVNLASAAELARLPGLTPERSQRLQRERRRAPFRDLAELGERLCLPAEVLESWIGRVDCAPGSGRDGWRGMGASLTADAPLVAGPGGAGSGVPGSGLPGLRGAGAKAAAPSAGSGAAGSGALGFRAAGSAAAGSGAAGSEGIGARAAGFQIPGAGAPASGASGQGRSGLAGPELPPAPRTKGSGPAPAPAGGTGPSSSAGRAGASGRRGPAR
jgi:DNA uptake protein ComE-like DNA-binding protein